MHFILLCLLALCTKPLPEIPNFYPSYPAALEAAKSNQKEILIFFSKRNCDTCVPAWQAFEKDDLATKKFISTLIDAADFDGGVLFEMFELTEVPCWVVLTPEGKLKDKWPGGWKDTSGNPTLYAQNETKKLEVKPVSKSINETQESISPLNPNTTTTTQSSKTISSGAPSTSNSNFSGTIAGVVLQAGYFSSEANGQKLVSELQGKGFNYFTIKPTQQNGTTFFRVISKTFNSESEANNEIQSLSVLGIKATVKKISEF